MKCAAVPVVLLGFNRPETTAEVMRVVAAARPSKLFAVLDGPRPGHPGDQESCLAVRQVVEASIPSGCELVRFYQDTNLGCRENVARGLDRVFAEVEEAVILEDDCVPDPSFFPFCAELLERYRHDPRVGMIAGTNYQNGVRVTEDSYYFSRHAHIWGWATWRRAWVLRDLSMSAWPVLRPTGWLREVTGSDRACRYWRRIFDDCHRPQEGSLNSWAVPWNFTCWLHCMRAVIPVMSLVRNSGIGPEATHSRTTPGGLRFPVEPMEFPLRHPAEFSVHAEADARTERIFFGRSGMMERIYWALGAPVPLATARRWQRTVRRWIPV